MNACHKNGLIHGEIKPENLLFESDAPDAHLKIIDFSISILKKVTPGEMKYNVGAVNYMSPERFTGEGTEKSDIWSAGVILYVILSGRLPPFQGKTDAETIKKIIESDATLFGKSWDTVSEEAKILVLRMLSRDPANRPTAEEILGDP